MTNYITLTTFKDVFAKEKADYQTTWEQLCQRIEDPKVFYQKKSMPLLKLALFGNDVTDQGSLRHDSNVLEVYGLEGDYDAEQVSMEDAAKMLERHGIEAMLYTSPRATKDKPRWRVLVPFSQAKEPEERYHYAGLLNAALGGILAKESFTLSQSYYYGKSSNYYEAIHTAGEPIDLKDGQWDPIFPKIVQPNEAVGNQNNTPLAEAAKALFCIPADEYLTQWIPMGQILRTEFGDSAFGLWESWSKTSTSFNPDIDLRKKWESFKGEGLGLGTLFMTAKAYGYEIPREPKATAAEDFGLKDEKGEYVNPRRSLLDEAAIGKTAGLEAPQWVIDGVIPNGVGVIAGVGGVGKTTAIMPLVATIAGFDDHLSNIKVKIQRHVLYITEDAVQAQKAIYSIKKWRKSNKDVNTIEDFVHLYNSKQYGITELQSILVEAVERYSMEYRGIMFPPLVVFDTAAANIRVENENDNAEIAKFMTMFKQLWARYMMPIWLVNHLAKSANGLAIDELDTHSARGASAWRDNSNWTANLAVDSNSNDRILQMMKVREELEFNEIIFSSVVHEEMVNDVFGDPVHVKYRYCTAAKSSKGARAYEHIKAKEDAILAVVKATGYPSKNDIQRQVTGSKNEVLKIIDKMVEKGILQIKPLPDDVKKRNQDSYYCGIS